MEKLPEEEIARQKMKQQREKFKFTRKLFHPGNS